MAADLIYIYSYYLEDDDVFKSELSKHLVCLRAEMSLRSTFT